MAKKKKVEESSHKRLSPSSLHRIFECPGSLLFIESLPESDLDRTNSLAARRGTSGHGVAEMVLKGVQVKKGKTTQKNEPDDFIGQEVEGVIVDEDILTSVVPYVKYCKKLMKKAKFYGIELKLDLDNWRRLDDSTIDGRDLGGTMDFVATFKDKEHGKVLEIVDLKCGKGVVVDVISNVQLYTYGLLALLNYGDSRSINRVKVTIAQNPAAYHEQGPIRSEIMDKKDLMKWAKKELIPKLELALSGNAPLIAGESQCKFCPARGTCKAAYELACAEAELEFKDIIEKDDKGIANSVSQLILPVPETMTREQRVQIITHADTIIDFIHAVKALEHIKAEHGDIAHGFKLVRKRANRIYKGEERKRVKALHKMGLTSADIFSSPSLRTPAQIEAVLKAKGVSLKAVSKFMDEFVEKPEGGTNLVPLSKAGKPVAPAIDVEFDHLIESDEDDLLTL